MKNELASAGRAWVSFSPCPTKGAVGSGLGLVAPPSLPLLLQCFKKVLKDAVLQLQELRHIERSARLRIEGLLKPMNDLGIHATASIPRRRLNEALQFLGQSNLHLRVFAAHPLILDHGGTKTIFATQALPNEPRWFTLTAMNHGGSFRCQVRTTKTDACQLKLRLQLPLKAWLQQQAIAARRSLTAEIELRLEASRQADQQPTNPKENP